MYKYNDLDPRTNHMIRQNKCSYIDTHELLKNEMSKQKIDQDYVGHDMYSSVIQSRNETLDDKKKITNQTIDIPNLSIGVEDTQIYFDSTYKQDESNMNNGTLNYSLYKLNNGTDINKCIILKIGSFIVPKPYVSAGNVDPLYFGRVYLEITNLPSTQGVLTGQSRYHFEMDVENIDTHRVKLIPVRDTIYFNQPVNTISILNFKFTVPPLFLSLQFPTDIYPANVIPSSNTLVVNGVTSMIMFGVPAGPTVPQIEMYFISPPSNDSYLNQHGYYITNTLDLPNGCVLTLSCPNFSIVTSSIQTVCTISIVRNRISFPMRFTTIKNNITNYTVNVHT